MWRESEEQSRGASYVVALSTLATPTCGAKNMTGLNTISWAGAVQGSHQEGRGSLREI